MVEKQKTSPTSNMKLSVESLLGFVGFACAVASVLSLYAEIPLISVGGGASFLLPVRYGFGHDAFLRGGERSAGGGEPSVAAGTGFGEPHRLFPAVSLCPLAHGYCGRHPVEHRYVLVV